MKNAQNMVGKEYQIGRLRGSFEDFLLPDNHEHVQAIYPIPGFEISKRQDWQYVTDDYGFYNLSNITEIDSEHKRLAFNIAFTGEWQEDHTDSISNPKAFAKLVKDIELTDDKMSRIIEEMFVMLFTPEILLKLEQSKDMEFIMNDMWIFLRVDKKAYRV